MRKDRTMAETQLTTWDGLARADTPPFGATVMVHARTPDGLAILLLRRSQIAHEHADWAWTPPAGARLPDEPIHICAARELEEETGIVGEPMLTDVGTDEWWVFSLEVDAGTTITLDHEHTRFEWVDPAAVVERCRPDFVHEPVTAFAASIVS